MFSVPCSGPVLAIVAESRLGFKDLPLWALIGSLSHVPYCSSADQEQKQQAFVCFCSEYPCSVFHVYKKQLFLSFTNGFFLVRHAVSWQSTLLGLTAGYAVLKINFADVCISCSPLIYFSLVHMHVRIPVCPSLCCCCCCHDCASMEAVISECDSSVVLVCPHRFHDTYSHSTNFWHTHPMNI